MDEYIEVSLERIQNIIDSFNGQEFETTQVLKNYSGCFYSNKDTPAYYSFNAQFGKLLKRNMDQLNITEIRSNVSTKDDRQNSTTTSIWRANT